MRKILLYLATGIFTISSSHTQASMPSKEYRSITNSDLSSTTAQEFVQHQIGGIISTISWIAGRNDLPSHGNESFGNNLRIVADGFSTFQGEVGASNFANINHLSTLAQRLNHLAVVTVKNLGTYGDFIDYLFQAKGIFPLYENLVLSLNVLYGKAMEEGVNIIPDSKMNIELFQHMLELNINKNGSLVLNRILGGWLGIKIQQ